MSNKIFSFISIFIVLFYSDIFFAQSPYLSFKANINGTENYYLELKMWDLSQRFDTSYLKGQNKIIVSESNLSFSTYDTGSVFEFGNQWFTVDHIFGFYIIEENKDIPDTMAIAFVVEEYSWFTKINLENIDFKPGYYEVPITYTRSSENNSAYLTISENYNWDETPQTQRRIILP